MVPFATPFGHYILIWTDGFCRPLLAGCYQTGLSEATAGELTARTIAFQTGKDSVLILRTITAEMRKEGFEEGLAIRIAGSPTIAVQRSVRSP